MSENKTPREMADLYCKDFDPHDYGIGEIADLLHSTYLVACEAGARMGWEARDSEARFDVGEMRSCEEWWASLEGEK